MSQVAGAATNREAAQQEDLSGPPAATRHRLPDERAGITHHFSIAGHEGYLTVGLYPMVSRGRSLSGWQRRARRSRD
jgi:ribonucleoside-diphosphate reductase alpha chain